MKDIDAVIKFIFVATWCAAALLIGGWSIFTFAITLVLGALAAMVQ